MWKHEIVEDSCKLAKMLYKQVGKTTRLIENMEYNVPCLEDSRTTFFMGDVTSLLASEPKSSFLVYGDRVVLPYSRFMLEILFKGRGYAVFVSDSFSTHLQQAFYELYLYTRVSTAIGPLWALVAKTRLYERTDEKGLLRIVGATVEPTIGDYDPRIVPSHSGEEPNNVGDVYLGVATLSVLSELLTCKNIATEEIKPSEKVNKRRAKKNKSPFYSYHVLKVSQSQKRRSSGLNPPQTTSQALHYHRGHFKTYTPEKPLLGFLTGTYWWEPHARGAKENGAIGKDYDVSNVKR